MTEAEEAFARGEILLSGPQYELVTTPSQFPAFVGGFGSGKTQALIHRALMLKAKYPKGNIAYYLPTFDLVAMIAIPRFEEELDRLGADYHTVKSPRPYIEIKDGGQIIFRTMDNPNKIVGYEVTDSFVDELDILKEKDAENAWNKIVSRNRQKKSDGSPNTIAVGTTPEGFRFVYQRWQKNVKPGYKLIRASTHSNHRNLPADYIENLMSLYPSNLITAYIDGHFVNLTSGSVYPEFDRTLNASSEVPGIITLPNKQQQGEDLHIGMDFNVTKMAAVVFVRRGLWPHAVGELTKMFDTPAMIRAIKTRYPNNRIFVYPDASGGSRKSTDASTSDLALLHQANFEVHANPTNPAVKDRVLSVNGLIVNGERERRLFVNTAMCPDFTEALEKQAYDANGEPDKSAGLDHAMDAGGYFIAYSFPVAKGDMRRVALTGH